MYICFKGIETHDDIDVSKFMPAIINELQTGVDETWLLNKDLDNLTKEYVRQVCFLTIPEEDDNQTEEQIAQENKRLLQVYEDARSQRYNYRMTITSDATLEDRELHQIRYKQKKAGKSAKNQKQLELAIDPRSREEKIKEGEQVSQAIEFGSVIPEREGLPFYIISMKWFSRWQRYTGCLKIEDSEDENSGLPTKDKSKIILGPHPGSINQLADIKDLCAK